MSDGDSSSRPTGYVEYCDIKEAALRMGCDHHYVRSLIKQGRIAVHHTEPINSKVDKVFVSKDDVKYYIEEHRQRRTWKFRCTDDEYRAIKRLLRSMRVLPDW